MEAMAGAADCGRGHCLSGRVGTGLVGLRANGRRGDSAPEPCGAVLPLLIVVLFALPGRRSGASVIVVLAVPFLDVTGC